MHGNEALNCRRAVSLLCMATALMKPQGCARAMKRGQGINTRHLFNKCVCVCVCVRACVRACVRVYVWCVCVCDLMSHFRFSHGKFWSSSSEKAYRESHAIHTTQQLLTLYIHTFIYSFVKWRAEPRCFFPLWSRFTQMTKSTV